MVLLTPAKVLFVLMVKGMLLLPELITLKCRIVSVSSTDDAHQRGLKSPGIVVTTTLSCP